MRFLKRAWKTLTALPVYASALVAIATEGAGVIAKQLPAGQSGAVLHAGAAVAAVVAFGAYVVTRVEQVAPELRGFPTASLSKKAQVLLDLQAENDGLKNRLAVLEAAFGPAPVDPAPAPAPLPVAEPVVAPRTLDADVTTAVP